MSRNEPEGRTRWGRMSLVALPAVGAVAGMTMAMMQGILAASVTIAGLPTQIVSENVSTGALSLQGNMLTSDATSNNQYGTALAGLSTASLSGLCANVHPVIAGTTVSVMINAGNYTGSGGSAATITGTNLVVNATTLSGNGNATVSGATLGQAGSTDANATTTLGTQAAGTWDTAASSAVVPKLNANLQDAVISGTITLPALNISAALGSTSCPAP